jgi:polysaccharide chain length determinant protein (PEP-CTERM system associated)
MKEQILSRSRLEPIIKQYNLGDPKADMDTRVDKTRKDIEIRPIHSEISGAGGLPGFFISFQASDPHTAQLVCRQITSLFLTENLKSREQSAQGTTNFIEQQLNDAKNNLDAQDAKLAQFQQQNLGTLPDDQAANMNMLTTLGTQLDSANQELTRLGQQRSYLEALLASQGHGDYAGTPQQAGQKAQPRAAAQATPEQAALLVQLEKQEADLTARYTPDYPDVISTKRQIADLKKQIAQNAAGPTSGGGTSAASVRSEPAGVQQVRLQIQAIDDAMQAKRRDQATIQHQIGMYQSRMEMSPLIAAKYKELTRDYQTAQEFYDNLLSKEKNSQMATELEQQQQGEQFRVMDDANLPDQPTSPKRSMFVLGGLAVGIGLGVLIAAYLEYRDKSLRSERDVWAFTKLPTLGIIAFSPAAPAVRSSSWFKRRLKGTNQPMAKVGG